MSAEDLTTQCSCYAYAEQSAQHAMACDLWDNNLFEKGQADWDPNLEMLVLVHPIHQSLHEMSDEEVAKETGGLVIADETDPVEAARMDFEDRCLTCEEELWETVSSGQMEFPPFNYTIDGISRVFGEENCEWENAKLGCHCEPSETTICNCCGVWREKASGEGTWHEQQWRPSIIRQTDICCRCADKDFSAWNCSICEVKRTPSPTGVGPQSQPMMRWTEDMKRKSKGQKPKGGVTAWSGFGTGAKTKTTTYVTCRHKGRELLFPNGKKIYGSSCHAKAPDDYVPDFGFYLDSCWFGEAKQLGIMVPWQDMGLPKIEREHVDAAVTLACTMIDRGDTIEVGCIGGHGRTGTFLAIIALRNGVEKPVDAIEYVRKNYCQKAIESATQEWYVEAWHAIDNDLPIPEKPQPKPVGNYQSNGATHRKNGNVLTVKKNDMSVWYCPECNADVDDDADACYWCLAKFSNAGILPLEDWTGMNVTPLGIAKVEKRILEPQKVPVNKLRKPPVMKVVTTGTTPATQSSLPFGTPETDAMIDDLESQMLGGWGGPF